MSKKRNYYPAFILIILSSFISFLVWSGMQAAESGPQVTDKDYYSKGLRYTSTILEKKAATAFGWTVNTLLEGRTLTFRLTDKDGHAVKSAKGILSIYIPESGASLTFPLQEAEPGLYVLHLSDSMKGELSARLEFEQAGARLNRQLLLNL